MNIDIFTIFLVNDSMSLKAITPQATLPPAFPVFLDSSSPPFPKSSSFSCTTQPLPTIVCYPYNVIHESYIS